MDEENTVRLFILGLGCLLGFALGGADQQAKEDTAPAVFERDLVADISTQTLCEELVSREGNFVKVDGEWQVDMDQLDRAFSEEGIQASRVRSLRCLQSYDPWEFEQLQSSISSGATD